MIGSAPRFPTFEDWQKMSDREQDALLASMEAAQRWGALARRLLVVVIGAAAAAVGGLALLAMW